MRLIEIAVEPKWPADLSRLLEALRRLCDADALLSLQFDADSRQTILGGETESQLEAVLLRLRDELGVQINVGPPQVAYRETISKTIEHDYTHKKLTGGSGQFARIKVRFEPLKPGGGYEFENDVVGGTVPKEYVLGVEKGLAAARSTGVIAGFPAIDFKCTLVDGAYHDVDSSALAFEIAARACFREGIAKAGPKLLEPIMKVEVVTPEDYMGDVIGDLNSRRGTILGMDRLPSRPEFRDIRAQVPLANMFGYSGSLRAMTNGRAEFSMSFDCYERAPSSEPDPDFPGAAAAGIP